MKIHIIEPKVNTLQIQLVAENEAEEHQINYLCGELTPFEISHEISADSESPNELILGIQKTKERI